ncbi:sirohydrochlorin chelatase [Gracilibacillus phocaeensis]|uniref:sirohydrochlorin chelatase n=1 Tax=Gracilibacillus phocaeensis TaxID=2042304 RepID=UPI00102F328C|nr:sirohydrochlorin chelatase [Gracilibacillus phocaeensis]
MEAVIYICHGSRVEQAKHESMQLLRRVKDQVDAPIQKGCFLELQEPNISDAVAKVVEQGATKIVVMPILLLTAGHAKRDIPKLIEQEHHKYPEVEFVYGKAIEVDDRMVDVLAERIDELPLQNLEHFEMLLVGRGSSDPDILTDMEQLANMLQERYPNSSLEVCFLAAAKPKFEQLLQAKVNQSSSVIVIPYLLFTGLLDRGIKEYIASLNLGNDQQVLRTDYLGHHPNVVDVLVDRTKEAMEGAADRAEMAEGSS